MFKNTDSYPSKGVYRAVKIIRAITVGYKIYIFIDDEFEEKRSIFCYDVINKSWAPEDTSDPEFFDHFSCAKMFKH